MTIVLAGDTSSLRNPESLPAINQIVKTWRGQQCVAQNEDLTEPELKMSRNSLRDIVLTVIESVVGETRSPRDAMSAPFMSLGFSSLEVVQVPQRLSAQFKTRFAVTLLFDYPTANSLVEHLAGSLCVSADLQPTFGSLQPSCCTLAKPLLITSADCYSPGGCCSLDSWSTALLSGWSYLQNDLCNRFSTGMNDLATYRAHFLSRVEFFDASFFNISPAEAMVMDPQQRLLLEVGYRSLAAAGESRESLPNSSTAVFVGVMTDGDWMHVQRELHDTPGSVWSPYTINGAGSSPLCGRLSFCLGLKGPSLSINTMCSASLVALDCAALALQLDRTKLAITLGTNLILHPSVFHAYTSATALAPNGNCKTFDASADGLGRGEACAAVVLKVDNSESPIVAMYQAGAVNQDGRSISMSAPNSQAQLDIIQSVMQASTLAHHHCSEAHGTGTPLGDPIEVGALLVAYSKHADTARPLALGAVKTRVGHTEGAAGVIGVLKAILTVSERSGSPNLHLKVVNPKLDMPKECALAMPSTVAPQVNNETPSSVGVSAYGMSGTNAHVILAGAEATMPSLAYLRTAVQYRQVPFGWWMPTLPVGASSHLADNHMYTEAWVPSEQVHNSPRQQIITLSATEVLSGSAQSQNQVCSVDEVATTVGSSLVVHLVAHVAELLTTQAAGRAISILQGMLAATPTHSSVWFVASPVTANQGSLAALSKVVYAEAHDLRCGYISGSSMSAILVACSISPDPQSELLVNSDMILVKQLQRFESVISNIPACSFEATTHTVLTGGTGALGMFMACWLSSRGVAGLTLVSRSGTIDSNSFSKWEQLSSHTVSSSVDLCNVAENDTAWRVLDQSDSGDVVHLAGQIKDALLPNQTQTGMQQVWAGKAHAAYHLHDASHHH